MKADSLSVGDFFNIDNNTYEVVMVNGVLVMGEDLNGETVSIPLEDEVDIT